MSRVHGTNLLITHSNKILRNNSFVLTYSRVLESVNVFPADLIVI